MSVAGEVSYLRRFAGKFVEIVAAGIGTAVSGYLVAHLAGYFSFVTPAAVETTAPPQAVSSIAETSRAETAKTDSLETRVRAALTSVDVSRSGSIDAATAPASPPGAASMTAMASTGMNSALVPSTSAPTSDTAIAPPLAATEIKSLPVAAAVDPTLPPEQDAELSDRPPANVGSTTMLPPQPPPVNGGLFSAFKHFHGF
jgi:hypothetical protein